MTGSAQGRNSSESPILHFADKVECGKRRCPVSGREFTVIGNCAGAFCFNGISRGGSLSLKLRAVGDFEGCPELFTNYLVRVDARGAILVAVPARGGRAAPAPFRLELNTEKNRLRLVPVLHPGPISSFVFEAEASLIDAEGKTLEVCTAYLWAHFQTAAGKPGRLRPETMRKAPDGMRNALEPDAVRANPYSEACADLRKMLNEMQALPEPETADERICRGAPDFWQDENPCAFWSPEKLQ